MGIGYLDIKLRRGGPFNISRSKAQHGDSSTCKDVSFRYTNFKNTFLGHKLVKSFTPVHTPPRVLLKLTWHADTSSPLSSLSSVTCLRLSHFIEYFSGTSNHIPPPLSQSAAGETPTTKDDGGALQDAQTLPHRAPRHVPSQGRMVFPGAAGGQARRRLESGSGGTNGAGRAYLRLARRHIGTVAAST